MELFQKIYGIDRNKNISNLYLIKDRHLETIYKKYIDGYFDFNNIIFRHFFFELKIKVKLRILCL